MSASAHAGFQCTYLLPIRRVEANSEEMANFIDYFALLRSAGCEVLVIDGSPPRVFNEHHASWAGIARHVAPDPKYTYLNGKVNGVHTGVDLASYESIILADDDIRYSATDIERMGGLLKTCDMVRPQNFLDPLPFWARIETARILINRGTLRAGDYPGTCAFRRSTMNRLGPYDGDVLFDNEEIVRHFAFQGADINYALDFFILKRPPTFAKWLEQRPRQAYEDFVMRAKTAAFLSIGPLVIAVALMFTVKAAILLVAVISLLSILLSGRGLRRDHAYRFFPMSSPLFAPLWIAERAISVNWALYWRLRYGGYPFGAKLVSKGTGTAWVAGGRIQSRTLARSSRLNPFIDQQNV